MDSLNETVAKIRAARNARNIFREDPILSPDDREYRAGTLRSTREFPGYVGACRKGRYLPPSTNAWDDVLLHAIFKEGGRG